MAASLALLLLVVAAANLYVLVKGDAKVYANARSAEPAQTAVVLGALVEPDGKMSLMLADRVRQAAMLWKAGKVERILASGDHGNWKYDEPTTMRLALIRMGVPSRVIFTDHAGFNTRASMERAADVFGVSDALVVTQGFHMKRALYLADAAGLDARGVTSDFHEYGAQGLKSDVREVASRVKAVGDVIIGSEVIGGPPVPIDGPAAASWGPSPPADTPPAGAPER